MASSFHFELRLDLDQISELLLSIGSTLTHTHTHTYTYERDEDKHRQSNPNTYTYTDTLIDIICEPMLYCSDSEALEMVKVSSICVCIYTYFYIHTYNKQTHTLTDIKCCDVILTDLNGMYGCMYVICGYVCLYL